MAGGTPAAGLGGLARRVLLAGAVLVLPAPLWAEPLPLDPVREARVAAALEAVRGSPPELRVFLRGMPKGGDLHNHLGGAIYAEDFLRWAAARGFCVAADGQGVEPPPCPAERAIETVATRDEFGFDRLIDALSTRGWQRGVGTQMASGHAQFFSSFARFGPMIAGAGGEMLAAARRAAAGDNLSYLELGHNPDLLGPAVMAAGAAPLTEADLPARYAAEVRELAPLVPRALAELDAEEAAASRAMACGSASAEPGCAVTVRYAFQGLRALPPAQVYRSLILGFLLAAADPRFVGVNIVMPEDAWPARRDYRLHMAMLRFMAARYPQVRLTLHAGELTQGLVPPADLADHIAQAVAAGARRIGHGSDIAYEDQAEATLARMAREHIAVEVSLTSNAVILGVKGADHPLALYRARGVPVVLSTDDAGVLRTDMTAEYVRAVREQGLGYADLKAMARAALEYAFLPGASLWADAAKLAVVPACADLSAPSCQRHLAASLKARLQVDLERRFAAFEEARAASPGNPRTGQAAPAGGASHNQSARNAYSLLHCGMVRWDAQT